MLPYNKKHISDQEAIQQDDPLKASFASIAGVLPEALAARESILSLFVEHAPAAIAMFDREMRYIAASRRYLVDYRLSDTDISGRSHYDIFPEIPERWKAIHRRCLAGATEMAEEDPFPRADGTLDWVRWEIHPWYTHQGEIGGIILFSEVITEQKQAQETIQRSQQQLQALVTSLDDIVIELDEQGCYLNVWTSDESLLVQPKSQLIGRRIEDIFGGAEGQEFARLVQDVLKSGMGKSFEYPLEVIGGQRWFVAQMNFIPAQNGLQRRVVMLVRDITKRKQAEREIQQRNEDLLLISTLNEAVNNGEDLAGIVAVFARETRRVFACQDAAIYLLSADGKYLEMQGTTIPGKLVQQIERLIGQPIPKIRLQIREDGYFKQILGNEQGLIASDPQVIQSWIGEFTETTFVPPLFRPALKKMIPQIFKLLGITSTISIPLISSGKTIGILDLSSSSQFSQEDLQRIRSISHQMTAILIRKQAEIQIQTQLERMRALNQIDRAINSSLDMNLSLDILLSEVLSQLEVDAADVLLFHPSSQMLEYVTGRGFRGLAIRKSKMRLGEGLAGKAGMEHRVLHITDLAEVSERNKRAQLFKEEKFAEYYAVPLIAKGQLKGVLEILNRTPVNPDGEWLSYLETLGGQAAIAIDNAQMFEGMQQSNLELTLAYDETITGWSRAMDLRDKETEGHTQRVTELTLKLAERMGISKEERINIRRGALLHDIGKLGIPDHILLKPGSLSDEEWLLMRQHPQYAHDMLMAILYLQPALDIPYCHHEKWDGSGYPQGLMGEQIPLAARLFCIVDVWDALRSDRPYRASWSFEKTRAHIIEQSGKHFDPRVVDVFLSIIDSK